MTASSRAGVRRLRAAGRHRQLHRRAGGIAQQRIDQGLRRHRQHQVAGRGHLQADCLLRRHPRRRRPRLRRRVGRSVMDSSTWKEGLHRRELEPGKQRPAASLLQPQQPHRRLQQQGFQRNRNGYSLRGAHDRSGTVQELQRPHLQRHQHQRGLRELAQGQLSPADRLRRRQPGAARHYDAVRVRQRLLQQPAEPEGAPALRPGALQRRQHRQHCQELRLQQGGIQQRLRRGHGEDGQPRPLDRVPGADQAHMLQSQLRTQAFSCK